MLPAPLKQLLPKTTPAGVAGKNRALIRGRYAALGFKIMVKRNRAPVFLKPSNLAAANNGQGIIDVEIDRLGQMV